MNDLYRHLPNGALARLYRASPAARWWCDVTLADGRVVRAAHFADVAAALVWAREVVADVAKPERKDVKL